jgi:hypothetical protein
MGEYSTIPHTFQLSTVLLLPPGKASPSPLLPKERRLSEPQNQAGNSKKRKISYHAKTQTMILQSYNPWKLLYRQGSKKKSYLLLYEAATVTIITY